MLQDFLPSSNLVSRCLRLPCMIQSKILTYYLSYGTIASHAMRAENGNGKCENDEVTIWRPRPGSRFLFGFSVGSQFNINRRYTFENQLFVLRESVGFAHPDVFFYMRLAMTTHENHHTRFYLNHVIEKITKERLLKLIAEEPVTPPRLFTSVCGV